CDDDVDVGETPARRRNPSGDVAQQTDGRGVAVAVVIGREQSPEIGQARRAEQRIGDRVRDRVGVRVPGQRGPVGLDAAAYARAALGEGRAIETEPAPGPAHNGSRDAPATSAAAATRSAGVVTFRFAGSPGTTTTRPPAASISAASSVASASEACASRSRSARNACGVCTATSPSRVTVSTTRSPSTRFTVSGTGTAGTAASAPARTAVITASNSAGDAKGRAASCTTMMVADSGTSARPARTDAERLAPPTTAADT